MKTVAISFVDYKCYIYYKNKKNVQFAYRDRYIIDVNKIF